MARFRQIDDWPGSILYDAPHGRLYCVAPRGLIPEHPYHMDALRSPSPDEQRDWGPGVLPRMVVDVTNVQDLAHQIRARSLYVAPWNAYLVLQLDGGMVIVAYRISPEMPRLDRVAAEQVALASGHDVSGWSHQHIRHFAGERWHFTPPAWEPLPSPVPDLGLRLKV